MARAGQGREGSQWRQGQRRRPGGEGPAEQQSWTGKAGPRVWAMGPPRLAQHVRAFHRVGPLQPAAQPGTELPPAGKVHVPSPEGDSHDFHM